MAAHDAERGGQPEPATREFRGEKRIENFRAHLGRHAHTVVAHLEENVFARQAIRAGGTAGEEGGVGLHRALEIVITPARPLVASAALSTRFITIWRSWVASAITGGNPATSSRFNAARWADGNFQQRHEPLGERAQIERLDHEAALAA